MADRDSSGFLNKVWGVFGFPNTPSSCSRSQALQPARSSINILFRHHLKIAWERPWPLTAQVPIVAGALILAVAIAVAHVMMSTIAREQELGVRRLTAVYLDGISTTIY